MRFAPKSEEQVSNLLKSGEGDFEVRQATDKVSQSQNEMIELVLDVHDANGKKGLISDYLIEGMAHKLRHFCYAVGLGHVYEAGELTAEACRGRSGRCVIGIEKDSGGVYPDKNKIRDYVVADSTKKTEGYQNAKDRQQGASAGQAPQTQPTQTPAKQAMINAWQTFQGRLTGETQDFINTSWRRAYSDYFGSRQPDTIGVDEWNAFVRDEFVKQPVRTVQSGGMQLQPMGATADIPF